jgi:hypothetical protein
LQDLQKDPVHEPRGGTVEAHLRGHARPQCVCHVIGLRLYAGEGIPRRRPRGPAAKAHADHAVAGRLAVADLHRQGTALLAQHFRIARLECGDLCLQPVLEYGPTGRGRGEGRHLDQCAIRGEGQNVDEIDTATARGAKLHQLHAVRVEDRPLGADFPAQKELTVARDAARGARVDHVVCAQQAGLGLDPPAIFGAVRVRRGHPERQRCERAVIDHRLRPVIERSGGYSLIAQMP